MAQIRNFTSTNDSYFVLDGVSYPKVYEAMLDNGYTKDRIKLVGTNRDNSPLVFSTHYLNIKVDGVSFASAQEAISRLNQVVFSKGGGSGGGGTGINGKSAYEIAVLNGFEGTEGEWLASLKGADGDDFTYEDFTPEQLANLKGADGYTPIKGVDYFDGVGSASSLESLPTVAEIQGTLISGSNWSNTGTIVTRSAVKRTDKIAIKPTDEIWIKANYTSINIYTVFFDENSTFITGSATASKYTDFTKLTVPPTARFIASSAGSADDLIIQKRFVTYSQISDTVKDVSALKPEVATLSPRVKKVEDLGIYNENIPFTRSGNYNRDTGAFSINSTYKSTDKIPTINRKITFNGVIGANAGTNIIFYNSSDAVIGYYNNSVALTNYEPVQPAGTAYITVSVTSANTTATINSKGQLLVDIQAIPLLKEEDKRLNGVATDGVSNRYYRLGKEYDEVRAVSTSNPEHYALLWMGQSNAAAYASYADLATLGLPTSLPINNFETPIFNNSISIPTDGKWGVWWGVLKRLSDYLTPSKPIYFYKNAVGGTSIRTHWNPDLILSTAAVYPLYHTMAAMKKMKEVMPTIKYRAVVWIQGENEEFAPYNAEYQGRLKNFISFIRGRADMPYLPFIIVGMHPNQTHFDAVVRESQIRVCNETPNCIFIDPSSLTWSTVDGTHYDGAYNERLAPLIFEAIKNL